ncbi:unknown [Pasteurella phage F108]|uniref:Uncharacterized protein n=1 Tax=Pasteurella phage F108 TaxID=2911430 RepID=Q1I0Z5_9CAUD|nr:hypothetical protein F108p25 [Pasteurella phage F108]AAZ93660.1 unknown [Pasteurella phage F108]
MKPAIKMGVNPDDLRDFLKDLELLKIPPKKKKEILIRTLQEMKKRSVKSASNQRTPTGSGWKPRKNGNAKMLRRIAKTLKFTSADREIKRVCTISRNAQRRSQKEHQRGAKITNLKSVILRKSRAGTAKDPATMRQAKKLRDLGYTVPNGTTKSGKKRYRRPSAREIVATLSRAKASLLIRYFQEKEERQGKRLTKWIIPTEKRPFLDERDKENAEILKEFILKFSGIEK